MNIRPRGPRGTDQAWQLVWCAGRHPGTGRPIRVYETVRGTRRQAERRWRERQDELVRQPPAARRPACTVAAWCDRWLVSVSAELRPTTASSYAGLVRCHIAPAIGAVRLDQLSADQVRGMLATVAAGRSPRTVAYVRAVLRIALQEAVRQELVPANVVDRVRAPRSAPRRISAFTADQARRLVAEAGPCLGPVLELAWVTGLRRGELLGLRWSAVDMRRRRLRVERARARVGRLVVEQAPKTADSVREISLPAAAVAALERLAALQAADALAAGYRDQGFVCALPDGRPMDPDTVSRQYRRLRDRAGLPEVPFHGLRHTSATLQLAAGAPVAVVSRRLGHRRISTTVDTYFHVLESADRAAADALDEYLDRDRGAD